MPLTAITDQQEIARQTQRFREILRGGTISPDERRWPVMNTNIRAKTGFTPRRRVREVRARQRAHDQAEANDARDQPGESQLDPFTTFLIGNQTIVQFRMRAADPDRNATGALAVDETGATWLIHKGVISSPRTSADFFERESGLRRTDVDFPGRGVRRWYKIGVIGDPDFIEALCSYVQVCAYWKGNRDDVAGLMNQHTAAGRFPAGNRPPSVIPPRAASTRECVEDRITAQLRIALRERRCVRARPEGRAGFWCDLVAEQPCEVIFEVKSGNDPNDYYCAIGQLFWYRFILSRPTARLVAVLERNPRTSFTEVLTGLGVDLLEFGRTGSGTYEFDDLAGLFERLTSREC
jgi:hypothetical protein